MKLSKLVQIFGIAFFASFLLCACNEQKSETANAKLTVAVTLQPYAKILAAIGGDRIDAISLIPANADPHSFEPKPATLKEFAKASLYFSDGSGMDKNWMPRFLGVNQNVAVVTISEGVKWNELEEHHHEGEHHEEAEGHDELDPHLWTSPKMVKVIANNMKTALCGKDAAGCETYAKNLEAYNAKMDSLDSYIAGIAAGLAPSEKKFMVFHPSFGYLARDYGLTQLAVEVEGKEPKPKDLQDLIESARQNSVKAVFVMPQFSKRAAESIAKAIDGTVQSVDPLSYEFEKVLYDFVTALKPSR